MCWGRFNRSESVLKLIFLPHRKLYLLLLYHAQPCKGAFSIDSSRVGAVWCCLDTIFQRSFHHCWSHCPVSYWTGTSRIWYITVMALWPWPWFLLRVLQTKIRCLVPTKSALQQPQYQCASNTLMYMVKTCFQSYTLKIRAVEIQHWNGQASLRESSRSSLCWNHTLAIQSGNSSHVTRTGSFQFVLSTKWRSPLLLSKAKILTLLFKQTMICWIRTIVILLANTSFWAYFGPTAAISCQLCLDQATVAPTLQLWPDTFPAWQAWRSHRISHGLTWQRLPVA